MCVNHKKENVMSWYKILISPQMVTQGVLAEITYRFAAIKASKNVPDTFNAFLGKRGEGGGMTIYFTPDATDYAEPLIRRNNGVKCEKPAIEELSFTLLGHRITPELLVDD